MEPLPVSAIEEPSADSKFPPPPRQARRIRGWGTLAFTRLIALPLVAAIVGFIIFALLVATHGTRVEGRIHEIYTKTFSDGQRFDFARYSYEIDGVTHHDEQRVEGDRFGNLKVNDPIPIRTVRILGRFRYSTLADGPKAFLDQYVIPIVTLMLLVSV